LLPLTFLPPELVVRFWIVGMQLLAVVALIVVYQQLGRPSRGELLAMVAISATFLPLIATALTGAMNTILLFLCALALPFLLRHQERRAGMLLGLAIGIKFLPAAALPYLLSPLWPRRALCPRHLRAHAGACGFDHAPGRPGPLPVRSAARAGLGQRLPGKPIAVGILHAAVQPRRARWRQRRTWGLHLVLVLLPIAILLRYQVADRAFTRPRLAAVIVALACFSVVRGAFYMAILHPFPGTPLPPLQIAMRLASESYVVGLLLLWLLVFRVLRSADAVAAKETRPRAQRAA
jgi:hypothetical protein